MPSIATSSDIFSLVKNKNEEFLLVHRTQIMLYQIIFSGMLMNIFCWFSLYLFIELLLWQRIPVLHLGGNADSF